VAKKLQIAWSHAPQGRYPATYLEFSVVVVAPRHQQLELGFDYRCTQATRGWLPLIGNFLFLKI